LDKELFDLSALLGCMANVILGLTVDIQGASLTRFASREEKREDRNNS